MIKKQKHQDWPNKIDFDYLENLEVEYYPAKVMYKSFFTMLNIPKVITSSFVHILSSKIEGRNKYRKGTIEMFEQQFFKVFEDAYSLDKNYKIVKKPTEQKAARNKRFGSNYGTRFSI